MDIKSVRLNGDIDNKRRKIKKQVSNDGIFRILDDNNKPQSSKKLSDVRVLNPFIMLDEYYDDEDEKLKNEAFNAIDKLKALRLAILESNISIDDLEKLENTLKYMSKNTKNPKLLGLIEEIELRVMVEVAKIEKSKI